MQKEDCNPERERLYLCPPVLSAAVCSKMSWPIFKLGFAPTRGRPAEYPGSFTSLVKARPIFSLSGHNPFLNNLCLGYISDQKGNKSSVASDTGQVLSSVVWGENAEGNKVRYPHSLLSFQQRTVRGRTDPLRGSLGGTPLFR